MTLLLLIQVLHILSATIWISSFIFIYFILWPAFIKKNSEDARELKENIKKPIGYGLGILGVTALILGFLRGTVFGRIRSMEALFTPYGRNFIYAIVISILMIVIGRVFGHNLVKIPWKTEAEKKDSLFKIYTAGTFILVCYFLILLCMVAMHFGGI